MFPNTLKVKHGQLTNWPAMEMVIHAKEGISSAAFSPDGQHIVSGLEDHTICVWNAITGAMKVAPLAGHTDYVNSVAFSQDGQWIHQFSYKSLMPFLVLFIAFSLIEKRKG